MKHKPQEMCTCGNKMRLPNYMAGNEKRIWWCSFCGRIKYCDWNNKWRSRKPTPVGVRPGKKDNAAGFLRGIWSDLPEKVQTDLMKKVY